MDYLDSNHLLSSEQYGFRNLIQHLISYLPHIMTSHLRWMKVKLLIYFSLQNILELGINGTILSWISDILSNRTMQVKVATATVVVLELQSMFPRALYLDPFCF